MGLAEFGITFGRDFLQTEHGPHLNQIGEKLCTPKISTAFPVTLEKASDALYFKNKKVGETFFTKLDRSGILILENRTERRVTLPEFIIAQLAKVLFYPGNSFEYVFGTLQLSFAGTGLETHLGKTLAPEYRTSIMTLGIIDNDPLFFDEKGLPIDRTRTQWVKH